jgi:iron complex transport system permease protein
MLHRSYAVLILVCLSLLSILFSLSKGSTSIPFDQLMFSDNSLFNTIFLQLRLPRTLTAFTTGGLLALAGSLMQLLLQNPLADPYTLGTSGGAALVTLLLMLIGINEHWLILGAWSGSLLSIAFVFILASKHHWKSHSLLLTGIALACGFSASISLIILLSPNTAVHPMLFWLAGDLNNATYPWLGMIILLAGLTICLLIAPGLNILGRGEKEARALGLSSTTYRISLYLLSSLFTATAVTLAGCIGFIGLLIPHMARYLTGFNHRLSLPVAVLLGGSLLSLADTLARSLFSPQQIPVGILIAMLGVPAFIWLFQR